MSKTSSSNRSRIAGQLLLAGLLLWTVSWFAAPIRHMGPLLPQGAPWVSALGNLPPSAMEAAVGGPEWLPGWPACRAAFHMLVDNPLQPDDHGASRRLAGSTCLTNLGMVAALLLLATGSAPRFLGVLLVACTALNASWLFLHNDNPFTFLRAGYFFWLVSFPLTGLGIALLPKRAKS